MRVVLPSFVLFSLFFNIKVEGHGYMIDPINRASLWRVDWTQPANYNDNEYFCGGTHVQYLINNGKCGPCGDDWRDPVPRSNENGGTFGNGILVANYSAGQVIEVVSLITANHLGSLYFHLCELEDPHQPETENCFRPLRLEDGTESHLLHPLDLRVVSKVKLPDDFSCERCVLRWHYRTGNSWGICKDGTQNIGCGDQEIFRSCADIRINPNETPTVPPEDSDDQHHAEIPNVPLEPAEQHQAEIPSVPLEPAEQHQADIPSVPLEPADQFETEAKLKRA